MDTTDYAEFQVARAPKASAEAGNGTGNGTGTGPGAGTGNGAGDVASTSLNKGQKFKIKAVSKTIKGKPLYVDECYFEYCVNKTRDTKAGKRVELRCNEYYNCKCPGRAWVYDDRKDTLQLVSDHNHVSDAAYVSAKLLVKKYKEAAIANPTVEPRTAYAQMMASRVLLPTERMNIPDRVSNLQHSTNAK